MIEVLKLAGRVVSLITAIGIYTVLWYGTKKVIKYKFQANEWSILLTCLNVAFHCVVILIIVAHFVEWCWT